MKKITTILLATITFYSIVSFGQTNKFDFGLEGGPSMTLLRGNDIIEDFNDPIIGFLGGLTFQYNFIANQIILPSSHSSLYIPQYF